MPADLGSPRRNRPGKSDPGEVSESTRGMEPLRALPTADRARELCLAALERRMRTRKELALMLSRKGVPPEVSGPVLDRLEEVGLVNDEVYARAFVASRQRTKPRGSRGLSAELYAKGVARDVIDRVLAEAQESEDPVLAARRAIAPKLRQLRDKPPAEIRRKAEQFLLRRGFSYQVAREALEAVEPDDTE